VGQPGVILLDTHAALWLTSDPSKLSKDGKAAIEDARASGEALAICDVTLLELTTLVNKGRILLSMTLESFLEDLEAQFLVLPISGRACSKIRELPANYPKDPVDRIIAATALVQGIPLLTADREIQRSKAVQTIW
jgi:PIN domain nuclease of toxin-antitoxin system